MEVVNRPVARPDFELACPGNGRDQIGLGALRRFGNARDIAEAVLFLASDRAGFISGQKLDVDGGYGV